MKKRKMQSAIRKELLEPIGLISVNFGMLESGLEFFIWILISKNQRIGQIVTAQLSYKKLVDVFSSLFRELVKDNQYYDEFEDIRKRLHKAEEIRNAIIHSRWGASRQQNSSLRIKTTATSKKGIEFKHETISLEEIKNIADNIAILASDLSDLLFKIIGK